MMLPATNIRFHDGDILATWQLYKVLIFILMSEKDIYHDPRQSVLINLCNTAFHYIVMVHTCY